MVSPFRHLPFIILLSVAAHFKPVFAAKTGEVHAAESSIVSAAADLEVEEESDFFSISIAVKYSDGGEVLLMRPFPEHEFPTRSKDPKVLAKFHNTIKTADGTNNNLGTFNIEDALKAAYNIDVEYIKCDLENIEAGAKIRFLSPAHIGELKKAKGEEMQIWELIEHLQRHDGKWGIRGKTQNKEEVFSVLFNGHSMVPLTNSKGIEVARFHLDANGLNIYKKDKNLNFLVANTPGMEESIEQNSTVRTRGIYTKDSFAPPMFSRRLTYTQLKRIGLDVIGGRAWGGPYKCRNFAYEFVQAIVADLHNFDAWPENLRRLDLHNRNKLDGSFAFAKSVPLKKKAVSPREHAHAHGPIIIEED